MFETVRRKRVSRGQILSTIWVELEKDIREETSRCVRRALGSDHNLPRSIYAESTAVQLGRFAERNVHDYG